MMTDAEKVYAVLGGKYEWDHNGVNCSTTLLPNGRWASQYMIGDVSPRLAHAYDSLEKSIDRLNYYLDVYIGPA